jgi:hypothetical protein
VTARRSQQGWSAVVVDLNRGAILRVDRGLQPLSFGSVRSGSLLCLTTSKELVAWDPMTGTKRAISR